MIEESRVSSLRRQWKTLYDDASTWRQHWLDVAHYIAPNSGAYLSGDMELAQSGDERMPYIINNTAGGALRTLGSGLHGGLTSPSRPWFQLGSLDPDLDDQYEVRWWLDEVRQRLLQIFARSNFYTSIHTLYEEVGAFGTGVMLVEEDDDTVIRCRVFTIGEYLLSQNDKYRADTLWRRMAMHARQMVDRFGIDKVSQSVRDTYEKRDDVRSFTVLHVIRPRHSWGKVSPLPGNMEYESIYFEETGDDLHGILRESGYRTIPFVAPRWQVVGVDVYGRSPGMTALPDVKQLQVLEEDKLRALALMIDPPLKAPPSMKSRGVTIVPGSVSFVTEQEQYGAAYQISVAINQVTQERMEVENRIQREFFTDLFVSILNSGKQMTATEVVERHDEKLLLLGPTLERLQGEMLDPIIDRAFSIAMERGLLPEPPLDLVGKELKVEYVSLLAQAQKMVGVNAINQLAGFAGFLANVAPEVLDKMNMDEALSEYAKLIGVPPQVLRDDKAVAAIRAQRANQQAMAAAAQAGPGLAQGAKNLSEIDPEKNTMLQNVLGGALGAMQQ